MSQPTPKLSARLWDAWASLILGRPVLVLLLALALTVACLAYAAVSFRIDTDFRELISNDLPFRKDVKALRAAFPQLNDTLLVVVEADTPEAAWLLREDLATRLGAGPKVFHEIFLPGGDPYFLRNGLLYLPTERLQALVTRLAEVQPLLGPLAERPTTDEFFRLLGDFVRESDGDALTDQRFQNLLGQVQETLDATLQGGVRWVSFQNLLDFSGLSDVDAAGEEQGASTPSTDSTNSTIREFLLLQPRLDYGLLNPVKPAMQALNQARAGLDLAAYPGGKVRVTGDLALKLDTLRSVQAGIGLAAAASLVLVLGLMYLGVRSWRLVGYSLATLFAGLAWTTCFALLVFGRLNLISVTFIVLFVGLGIDYAIQFGLRYAELATGEGADANHDDALRRTMRELGSSLFLCSVTTSIGFYSFAPTAYRGASELGVVAGTGMFFNLLATFTILPALMHLWGTHKPGARQSGWGVPRPMLLMERITSRAPRAVALVFLVLTLASLGASPLIRFDINPLDLNNPHADSVILAKELLRDPQTSLWTSSVLTHGPDEARALAEQLHELPVVASTRTVFDFIPADQEDKLFSIEEMALFVPPAPEDRASPANIDPQATAQALKDLEAELARYAPDNFAPLREDLLRAAEVLRSSQDDQAQQRAQHLARALDAEVLVPFRLLMTRLQDGLEAHNVGLDDLPANLRERYVNGDDYRVEVLPSEDLNDRAELARFVDELRADAPTATGTPVAVLFTGRSVSSSFLQAFLLALAAITVLLWLVFRKAALVGVVLLPLLSSTALTLGAAVLFDIPFNFANIIVIPLLLGIGLDYGIHLVFRALEHRGSPECILCTSTARGVLFSGLTTIASFSSLSFSLHQGTASMGILLTISLVCMLGCTLMLLPAVLRLYPGMLNLMNVTASEAK